MCKQIYRSLLTASLAAIFLLTSQYLLQVSGNYGVSQAEAQQITKVRKKKRRSLLQILFGGTRRDRRIKSRRRSSSKRRNTRRVSAVLPPVEKLENARTVLVVGDFYAGGLAKGLKRSFSQTPGVKIVGKSSGSSGFVRTDYYDWTGIIGGLSDELKPSVVVVMIGTNDRQLMRIDGKKLQKRTEEWDAAYKARLEKFARTVREKKVPLVWVGLPPVRFKNMNRDFLFFNEIYREKVEKFGGQYIDVWDGFSNDEGNFAQSGPDVNGRIVRLRNRDGINVTKAGQDKLAFYAEKGVKKYVGASAATLVGLPLGTALPAISLEPTYDPAKTGRTIIMRLDDPALDGGEILAGAKGIAGTEKLPKAGDLIIGKDNEALAAKTSGSSDRRVGRVDDFSWPPKQAGLPDGPKISTEKR